LLTEMEMSEAITFSFITGAGMIGKMDQESIPNCKA
jgi:hypothetical protein